jgi:hypothetical protein
VIHAQLAGDVAQRTIGGTDQLNRVPAELLEILRRTWHQDILPQTTVWAQSVRSMGGTSSIRRRGKQQVPLVGPASQVARCDEYVEFRARIGAASRAAAL